MLFITEIMVQADECEYGGMRDNLVRDRIVVGVADDGLRDHLLSVEDLTLDVCIRKAKQYVSQKEGISHLKKYGGSDDNVAMVSARRSFNLSRPDSSNINMTSEQNKRLCFFCSKRFHPQEQFPAQRATCHRCKSVGHWAKSWACRQKRPSSNLQSRQVNEVESGEDLEGLYPRSA